MQQPPWSCAGVSGGQESRERDKGVKEGDPLHSCGSTGAETAHRRDIQIHTAEEYHEQLGSGAHGRVVGSAGPGRAAASWSTERSVLWRLEAPFGRQRHQSIIVTRIVSESWLARIAFAVTHVGRLSASASAGVVAPVDPLSTRTNETRVLGIVLDHLWAAARDAPAHTPFLACAGALRFPAVAVDAVLGALHGVIAIVRLEMSNEKLVNPQSAKHGLEVPPHNCASRAYGADLGICYTTAQEPKSIHAKVHYAVDSRGRSRP